jgi:APA family basic amino acid/polyamine antiporter
MAITGGSSLFNKANNCSSCSSVKNSKGCMGPSSFDSSGTFEELITLVVFVNFMLWIAASSTVFVLRKKQPELERPYKVWGYPYVPAFFIIFSSAIMINTFIASPQQSLMGIGLTLLGIPAYLYWKKS